MKTEETQAGEWSRRRRASKNSWTGSRPRPPAHPLTPTVNLMLLQRLISSFHSPGCWTEAFVHARQERSHWARHQPLKSSDSSLNDYLQLSMPQVKPNRPWQMSPSSLTVKDVHSTAQRSGVSLQSQFSSDDVGVKDDIGHQAWWQMFILTELFHWPETHFATGI